MTRSELSAEFTSIVNLLRDHESLRYSRAGGRVYEGKLRDACGFFAALVGKAAGLSLPNPFPAATIDGMTGGSPDSGLRAAKRIASRLAALAARADEGSAERLRADAAAWGRAVDLVSRLPR